MREEKIPFVDFSIEDHTSWSKKDPIKRGGNLSFPWLISAYSQGFYPLYFGEGEEIFWWSPDPRMVLFLEDFHLSRRFMRELKKSSFSFTWDFCTAQVIQECAKAPRPSQEDGGTWIYKEVIESYSYLAEKGFVHSVEVWEQGNLVGGLYGILLGHIFFGESMFSLVSGASRAGFSYLIEILKEKDIWFIDCQQETEYLASMGAKAIPREEFYHYINKNLEHLGKGK